jgi:4-hydroxybenzoate polyprenyltransferase
LWALIVAGALVPETPVCVATIAWASVGIVASSLAAMHINVFTDAELDRAQKPELWAELAARQRLSVAILVIELLVAVACTFALLWRGDGVVAGLVALYTAMGTLYSFNFLLPHRSRQTRLKVYWWGHFATMFTVYMCLWSIGFLCCDGDPRELVPWVLRFALLSLCDYALFVGESAFDAEEERSAGLRTLAARLGRAGSTRCALIVAAMAAMALGVLALGCPVVRAAFLPPALASTTTLAVLAHGRRGLSPRTGRRLIDAVFVGNRIYILVALLAL